MNTVLLDTAVFLWALTEPARLSRRARHAIANRRCRLVVSTVSLWEVVVKAQKGLLPIPEPVAWLENGVRLLEADLLPIRPAHIYGLARLPMIHKDPFDRLLVAQAQAEGWPLVSSDRTIRRYPVTVVWE